MVMMVKSRSFMAFTRLLQHGPCHNFHGGIARDHSTVGILEIAKRNKTEAEGCKMQSSGPFKRDRANFRLKMPGEHGIPSKGFGVPLA
jgi:hypothetical protein